MDNISKFSQAEAINYDSDEGDSQLERDVIAVKEHGDKDAFNRLYTQFYVRVFKIAVRGLKSKTNAHDLTQDVFVTVFRKIHQVQDPCRFSSWVQMIARRMLINYATRQKVFIQFDERAEGKDDEESRLPDVFPESSQVAQANERVACLMDSIAQMPFIYSEVIQLFYLQERSVKEIAEILESPIGTIKRRLNTARRLIREDMTSIYPDYAESVA